MPEQKPSSCAMFLTRQGNNSLSIPGLLRSPSIPPFSLSSPPAFELKIHLEDNNSVSL